MPPVLAQLLMHAANVLAGGCIPYASTHHAAAAAAAAAAQVYGRYNWTLGQEWAVRAGRESPYLLGHNVTRVLALSPDIDLSRTRSWAEFSSIMAGLFQVHTYDRQCSREHAWYASTAATSHCQLCLEELAAHSPNPNPAHCHNSDKWPLSACISPGWQYLAERVAK